MTRIVTDMRDTREAARRIRFDPVLPFTATNVQDAITQGQAFSVPSSTSITVAASPYTVLATDQILLVNTSAGPVTINMQPGAARANLPLVIKDDTGNAAANPISVVPSGAETVDGLAPYPIDSPFSSVKFYPKTAGGYDVI